MFVMFQVCNPPHPCPLLKVYIKSYDFFINEKIEHYSEREREKGKEILIMSYKCPFPGCNRFYQHQSSLLRHKALHGAEDECDSDMEGIESDHEDSTSDGEEEGNEEIDVLKVLLDSTLNECKKEKDLSDSAFLEEPYLSRYFLKHLEACIGYILDVCSTLESSELHKAIRAASDEYESKGIEPWEARKLAMETRKFLVQDMFKRKLSEVDMEAEDTGNESITSFEQREY